ncbi:two-partner secretion domain-containing protein [Falsiroseomonas selenitidurans]|uniref:two-partner secretion domain-containing protein n=1 Tax=Falsiroseomonas selenitidurans TaxID=2716335 RepID=UPI001ADEBC82|nr:filamentous hemagglutinin N-terminal domain-containing protein [Falsiroseomonas selenitidurans]
MRRALLLASALATAATAPAWAQPAAEARPQGGVVVAGQARIAQTAARTQITQGSDRAILEWQRFDVGAAHQVDIRQPAATSWSLQRVVGGDPSAIAGRVTSNGGVALVNRAGVVFHQGAQVDVAALIATASDTTNRAFTEGRLVFDGAPAPGARVANRGTIRVADRGLAALVAPQVANAGSIRARLGRVALAAGEAFTLDLAGDGLLALDVTRQVAATPAGATALVTQTGLIEAEGGSVVLSAQAASGVLEDLVLAGGSLASRQVAVAAGGGGVRVTGSLAATGTLEATASGTLRLEAGSRIAAGRATLGAGADSRPGAPTRLARRTVVARGATVAAGDILVHGADQVAMHGSLAAPGGRIEVSSRGGLALDGRLEAGTILVDPVTLRVVTTLSGATEPAEITAATIAATTGALTLQAERAIRVEAAISKPTGPLTLETTAADATGITLLRRVTVAGDLALRSAGDITQSATGAGLNVGTLEAHAGGLVRLDGAGNTIRALAGGSAGGRFDLASVVAFSVDAPLAAADIALATPRTIDLFAPVSADGTLFLEALRGVVQQPAGAGVSAGLLRLDSALGAVRLDGAGNQVARLGDAFVPQGLSLLNQGGLVLAGGLLGGVVALEVAQGDLTQAAGARLVAEALRVQASQGAVRLDGAGNAIAGLFGQAGTSLVVVTAGDLSLAAPLGAPAVALHAGGALTQDQGARLTTLALRVAAGSVVLDAADNAVAALEAGSSASVFSLATSGTLAVTGPLSATSVSLAAGGALTAPGITAERLALSGASVAADGAVAVLEAGGATGDFRFAGSLDLRLAGALTVGGALWLEAPALALAAPVAAGSATLRATLGDLTQSAALTTAALRAEAPGGAVRLDHAGNRAGLLGGLAQGDFLWTGLGDLALDPVAGLAAQAATLAVGGSLTQAEAAAGLSATRLAVQAGGAVVLPAAANAVRELGLVAAPGGFTLASTAALRLTEPLAAPDIALSAAGGIDQDLGAGLATARLHATATAGAVVLDSPANDVAGLGASQAAGHFALTTGGALAILGPVAAGGTLTLLAAGDLTQAATGAGLTAPLLLARSLAGNLALAGAGNAVAALGASGAAGDFALAQQGAAALRLEGPVAAPSLALRTESGLDDAGGGALRAGLLRLDTAGPVRLQAGAHALAAIAGQAGSLALAQAEGLLVTEALSAGSLDLAAASIGVLAPVSAGAAVLSASSGDITQTLRGAGLTASLLHANATGQVLLDGQGNQVAALGAGQAGGAFALASEAAGVLRLTAPIAAESLFLGAAGGIADSPGAVLSAGLLRLSSPGSASLAEGHAVARLGGQLGALTLAAQGALAVPEALDVAGSLALSAASLHLAAPLRAGGATLTARAGDITQAASGAGLALGAGGLRLAASGAIALEGAGNAPGLVRSAEAGGTLLLASDGALTLAGAASGQDVVLRAAALRLDGAMLEADRAVLLAAPDGITAGATSRLLARDPGALPLLILDSRQGGLAAVPAGLAADIPGRAPAQQPVQLADFGPVRAQAGGPVAFDLLAGESPIFLLLDGGAALGTLEAGRLGLLGQGGSAFILGTLGGVGGEAAAQAVSVAAAGAPGYLFNTCVIAATTCSGVVVDPPVVDPPVVDPPVVDPPVVDPPVVDPPIVPPPVDEPPVVDPPILVAPPILAPPALVPAAAAAPLLAEWDLRLGAPAPRAGRREEEAAE